MDAYSRSVSSGACKKTSKIYQDLKLARLHSASARTLSIMDTVLKVLAPSVKAALKPLDALYFESLPPSRRPRIGIVGGGFAGLRCADVLLRNGFKVTILEARNRLGGRIFQQRLPNGHLVDVGANWIHGTNDNPIMDLVQETRTAVGVWDSMSCAFDEDGRLLPLEEGEKYSTLMWKIIEDAFEHSNKHGSEIDPDRSLLDFFREQVVMRIPDTEPDYERQRNLVLQVAELWGSFVGSPLSRQSLKFFWLEECIEGENLFCAGTYHKVLEKVAQPALEGAEIRYQTRVTEVHGKSTGPNDVVRVMTADGQCLEFEEVVVTCPLGWLKQNLQAFSPPLPDRLCKAIRNISYGNLEKVYISFPTSFWLTTSLDEGRTVQGFCQWLAPKYAPDTNPNRWLNETVELGSLGAAAHPTLLFYTYGEQSHYLTSQLRSLPSQKDKDAFLFEYFRPYYSRLPSYDASDINCQPTACFATDWSGDELAGNGSYCNFQAGLLEGDKDIVAMRHGVPAEGIWLAGEHTAPFVALGTVTGAYWSGEHVAKRIVTGVLGREG
ncbi:FAD/NAD(P)-binding domain-containing protein [Parathielavia appendiculata]|uniref:FAD/NAD(P)-binding domain-containing protein n=1 Tax=Parathielavia appendiculata TaxID=2587402 RepID=A0AAN6TW50_9PEZI|nr:FAD/NAD(P)-binding domain-containing protein [Parathielavia appendiculata]